VLTSNTDLLSFLSSTGGTAGGALCTGRIILVTLNDKQIQYVRAPSIVIRSPMAPITKNGVSDLAIICMVLLPEGYTSSEEASKKLKIGDLNYVGRACERNFVVREVNLSEIFLVSSIKAKIDSKIFFHEDVKKTPALSFGSPFASAKSVKGRQDDDIFAGMTARGKKAPVQPKTTALSQEAQLTDEVMSQLIKAEVSEKNVGVDILDLRDCAKNMHQGSSEMEFRQAVDRLEQSVAIVRQFQCHAHPNLEKHYATVDRKETLRSRVQTLQHLLSNESLQLFPDFLQRKALLMKLGYIDLNDTVCLKGRVACEVCHYCVVLIAKYTPNQSLKWSMLVFPLRSTPVNH
jgi:hypothetical protein